MAKVFICGAVEHFHPFLNGLACSPGRHRGTEAQFASASPVVIGSAVARVAPSIMQCALGRYILLHPRCRTSSFQSF